MHIYKSSRYAICTCNRVPFLRPRKRRVCYIERKKESANVNNAHNSLFCCRKFIWVYGNNGTVQMQKSSIHFISGFFLTSLKQFMHASVIIICTAWKAMFVLLVQQYRMEGIPLLFLFWTIFNEGKRGWGIYNKMLPVSICF